MTAAGARVLRPFRRLNRFMQLFRVRLPASVLGVEAERIGLLRQNSAFVIPVIEEADGKTWTVIGEEFRAGAAMRLTGFAAGSNDREEQLREMAARELGEELGIDPSWITGLRLIPTFAGADFVSPGGTNEQIALYEATVKLPGGLTVRGLRSRVRGAKDEAEAVTSHLRELTPELFRELHNMGEKLGLLLVLLERVRRGEAPDAGKTAKLVDEILAAAALGEHHV